MRSFRKIICLVFVALSPACSAVPDGDSFSSYWSDFRSALLEENYSELAQMTKLPLEVKGVADFIPSKFYEKQQLEKAFELLMEQQIVVRDGDSSRDMTMKELVEETDRVNKKPDPAGMIRVEQFVFKKVNNDWKLIYAYLESL